MYQKEQLAGAILIRSRFTEKSHVKGQGKVGEHELHTKGSQREAGVGICVRKHAGSWKPRFMALGSCFLFLLHRKEREIGRDFLYYLTSWLIDQI